MKTKYIIALSVLLVAGYFGYRTYQYHTDPLIAGIPPHENADGTIDYTLVHKWLYDKEPTYWVLRFPQDQFVETSEDWTGNYRGSGISVGLRTRPNQYLTLYFKDKELKDYLLKSESDSFGRTGQISVTLLAEDSMDSSKDGKSFEKRRISNIQKHCKLIEFVAPGIVRYGNEKKNNDGSVTQSVCAGVGHANAGYTTTYVAVQNTTGDLVGEFTCRISQNTEIPPRCSGRLMIGIARVVLVSFDSVLLPKAREIWTSIDEYLKRKSVRAKTSETVLKRLEPINN